jgi:TP901 family phage tail tape measure protein
MELFKLFGRIFIDNSGAKKELDETEKKAEETAMSIEDIGKKAMEIGPKIHEVAKQFVDAIGVKAVNAADELKKSMNLLQMQTGASDADMKKFRDSAIDLYETGAGESLDDIARAMGELSRTTGLSGEELEKTTQNALMLRDTFDMGVNESARTANSLMKNFGISSKEAYTLIAQGAQQGANKNGDLLDTLNEYSVQFNAMGFSAEEFTAVLIDGAKNGAFSIDKVGDAVKEFTIRSKDGSKGSTEAFQKLGFNAGEMTKAFASGGSTAQSAFAQVTQALAKIEDPVKKNAVGVALFGTQFEDLEAGAIEALGNIQTKTDASANTLDKMSDVKDSSFGATMSELGRQLQTNLFIPLGEKLIPKLNEFTKWIQDNSPTIESVLGGAVSVLGGLLGGLLDSLKFVIDNFNIFGPILAGVTAAIIAQYVIGTLIPMYKAWRASTVAMTVAQRLLNIAMKANPFGIIATIIGLVITAVVLLVANWDWVKEKASAIWGAITDFFSGFWEGLKEIFTSTIDWISEKITGAWEWIKDSASSIWDAIINFFKGAFRKIMVIFLWPVAVGLLIVKNWEGIKAKAIAIWNAIAGFFVGIWDGIKKTFSGAFEGIKNRISNLWDAILFRIKHFIFKVRLFFHNLRTSIANIFNGIREKIGNAIDKVKGIFEGLKEKMKSVFSSIWGFIKGPINFIIDGINVFIKGFETLLNLVSKTIEKIPKIKIPNWIPKYGGKEYKIPSFGTFKFDTIPRLAEGGNIMSGGTVMVGEEGPEFLNLPRGARVTPLDKAGGDIVININNPKMFSSRDGEQLANLLVRTLKNNGIRPRGV